MSIIDTIVEAMTHLRPRHFACRGRKCVMASKGIHRCIASDQLDALALDVM